jgi:tetratricopeptide (TPR) repeat protein
MHDFDDRQARQEVERLHQLAIDADDEAQFATTERLLEHAVSIAQKLDDLPLLIKERLWLAYAQEMQGKYLQALTTYGWLTSLANDPTSSQLLTDLNTLSNLMHAFMRFVGCGRWLPEMPVEELIRVVNDGLDWLERVGKANWAAGLRLEKGSLLKLQEEMEDARLEMETALALARRHPEGQGYNLAVYQLQLADLLRKKPFNTYAEALALADEVLSAPTSTQYDRWWAYTTLAYTCVETDKREEALSAAQQSLLLAQAMETPTPMVYAYELLGRIYCETGHPVEATQAVAQEWYWTRRGGTVEDCHSALTDCARVRNLQARVACGLPATQDSLPEQIPAQAHVALALRRVQSVRRFIRWATSLAAQLDRQSGRRNKQEELDTELQAARELERWLTRMENSSE